MVMHARKLPRIDDGYADKRESQSYQSSQYPSKTGYSNHSDRFERHQSPGINSTPSRDSPRYINKSAYIERAKERLERGMEASPGKKSNQSSNVGGSNNGDQNISGNYDIKPSTAKTSSNPKDKSEVQRSAIRTFGEWSEHLSSTGKKYYYNCKTEVSQWEKPREWNDVATSRTERQSTDSRASNDKHYSKENKLRHTSGSIEKRDKHLGDLRHMVADSNPKPDKMYLFEKLQQSQKKLQDEMRANQHPYAEQTDLHRRTDNNSISSDFSNCTSSIQTRRDSEGARTLAQQTPRNDVDEVESPGSTPTSHVSVSMPKTPVSNISTANLNIANIPNLITQLSGGQNNQEHVNKALQTLQKLQQALTRQIAAHQSSVANQPSQSTTVQALPRQQPHITSHQHYVEPVSSTSVQQQQHSYQQQQIQTQQFVVTSVQQPIGSQLASHRSPYMNSQNSISQSHPSPQPTLVALATNVSPVSKAATGTTTIPITQSANQVHRGNTVYGKFLGSQNRTVTPSYQLTVGVEKVGDGHCGDAGERSDLTPCSSPTPSDTSSQGAPVDPNMFSSESMGQRDNNLMTTLRQFYNENSVSHVIGWQGEIAERQARVYRDEGLKIGSLISSQISVELKRARSLVRVEEIQATLHEQRNLFLAQEIAELEGMRTVSSGLSYLPLSSSSGT